MATKEETDWEEIEALRRKKAQEPGQSFARRWHYECGGHAKELEAEGWELHWTPGPWFPLCISRRLKNGNYVMIGVQGWDGTAIEVRIRIKGNRRKMVLLGKYKFYCHAIAAGSMSAVCDYDPGHKPKDWAKEYRGKWIDFPK